MRMKHLRWMLALVATGAQVVCAADKGGELRNTNAPALAAPTFQELMDPAMFPEAQRGMKVESAAIRDGLIRIRTTGADITISPMNGELRFFQRIGHPRLLATVRVGEPLLGARLTHKGAGFARVTFEQPKLTLRVNGDSLAMLHAHQPVKMAVDRAIDAAWSPSNRNNHLLADEWGGFNLYCSDPQVSDGFDAAAATVATYALPTNAVLWVGVCPPKPYDWERSVSERVVYHWSRETSYPSNDVLRSWKAHGNLVLLQSEIMLWKDWNLDFVPRLGVEEFARVRDTLHGLGMRFIVYTSPHYFLKGTPLESQAINSFEGFKGWPPGSSSGENMELFMAAITRVMREYKPDGLYFDGQYWDSAAAVYALARRSRALLGENGILEWHAASSLCTLPQAEAYVDIILRGENNETSYSDPQWMRYFVSGYNLHNSIGVLCNNGGYGVPAGLGRDLLRVNARMHTLAFQGWLESPDAMKMLKDEYLSRLTPDLRNEVDREMDERQARIVAGALTARDEWEILGHAAPWGDPVFLESFTTLPTVPSEISSSNPAPFSITNNGILNIRAYAHTYAFLRYPLRTHASGVTIKLRQGNDTGENYGPAVALRWPDGSVVRVGTRGGNELEADILGGVRRGQTYDSRQWIWLRLRWGDKLGMVERSSDGQTYQRVWTFEHGGKLNAETAELYIGKVPPDLQSKDHTWAGDVPRECQIDHVEVYGEPISQGGPGNAR